LSPPATTCSDWIASRDARVMQRGARTPRTDASVGTTFRRWESL
jgi:hypothetical protein